MQPDQLFKTGYHDLISVIPPGAQLTPTSKIDPAAIGKIPGRRLGTGLWAGYDWRRAEATIEDVRRWMVQGANVGLRTDRFPAIDIDCTDDELARMIETTALRHFGAAPRRVGRAPKRLLLFRTSEPFSRMRLWFKRADGSQHLIEILGQGQQFVLHGIHPKTERPYIWLDPVPPAAELTEITHETALAFLADIESLFKAWNIITEREGDGRPSTRVAQAPEALAAPSIALLRECVEKIPNDNDLFPSRTDYLTMGYAIRAAAGADDGAGLELFQEWAAKWEGNDRSAGNEPETVEADWDRMRPPYSVGWGWLCDQARPHGFNDAALEFAVETERPDEGARLTPVAGSDDALADTIAKNEHSRLRYISERRRYLVWNGARWEQPADAAADEIIRQALRRIAGARARTGISPRSAERALTEAKQISSTARHRAVSQLLRSDPRIVIATSAMDADPWTLNTPSGIVDLKTGMIQPPNPGALCTRSTAVAPAFGVECPRWNQFLSEATDGDPELVAYLRRLAGYALTGRTDEQMLAFLFGDGGNGKTVFQNTLAYILGDYAAVAAMSTFQDTRQRQTPYELAKLRGARLVVASETSVDGRWNEALLKSITGGEPLTARSPYQDFETFTPQFTLILSGNAQPALREVNHAMRRRLQIVPFICKPAAPDPELQDKLQGEAPAILAWMIRGCLEWQKDRLSPPQAVKVFTDEYFADQDTIARWLGECCEREAACFEETSALYASYQEWCGRNSEAPIRPRQFSRQLKGHGFTHGHHSATRRAGFHGLRLSEAATALPGVA